MVEAGARGGGIHQPRQTTQPHDAQRGSSQSLHQRGLGQPPTVQRHLLSARYIDQSDGSKRLRESPPQQMVSCPPRVAHAFEKAASESVRCLYVRVFHPLRLPLCHAHSSRPIRDARNAHLNDHAPSSQTRRAEYRAFARYPNANTYCLPGGKAVHTRTSSRSRPD